MLHARKLALNKMADDPILRLLERERERRERIWDEAWIRSVTELDRRWEAITDDVDANMCAEVDKQDASSPGLANEEKSNAGID